ncbi:hypothetical protein K439DRAFT_1618951 [Ramaria rubella]|nr:hypothetical protein K439DRAFT_1618951 [Ramaria rubella]
MSGRDRGHVMLQTKLGFNLVTHPYKKLTPKKKELKKELQTYLAVEYHENSFIGHHRLEDEKEKGSSMKPMLLGPPQPGALPHLNAEGLMYMNPDFTNWVDAWGNAQIILKAAKLAKQEIENNPSDTIEELQDKILVTIKMLIEFGKRTWNGWAERFQGQVNSEKLKKLCRNQKVGHHNCRRQGLAWMSDEDSKLEGIDNLTGDEADDKKDDWE